MEALIVMAIAFCVLGLLCKPVRKTFGLIAFVGGLFISLTGLGIIIGLPSMVVGGIMLFS